MLESFLVKLQACKFIERRLQHWCFPLRARKFLRTPILKNIKERLLLIILLVQRFICLFTIIKKNNDLFSVKKMFIKIRLCNRMTLFLEKIIPRKKCGVLLKNCLALLRNFVNKPVKYNSI